MAARQRGPARYTGGHRPPLREKLRDLRAHNVRPYGGSCTVCGRMISAPTERENSVNKKIVPLILLCILLCGCQAKEKTPAISAPPPEPAPKTAQELLEEQIIDDTHDAFLVDTGGRLGTLLVTVERGEQNLEEEFGGYFTTLSVWNPQKMDSPIQTMEIEVGGWAFGHHDVVDANFDGHQDFGYLWFMGAHSSQSWYYWLWDEKQGEFAEASEFHDEDISSPSFNAEDKTVSNLIRYSGAGDGLLAVYQWVDGKLVCMRKIEIEPTGWTDYNSPWILTVRDRINGELTEVFRTEFPTGSDGYFDERSKWEDLDYHGETR